MPRQSTLSLSPFLFLNLSYYAVDAYFQLLQSFFVNLTARNRSICTPPTAIAATISADVLISSSRLIDMDLSR